jgi:hypothetical protein
MAGDAAAGTESYQGESGRVLIIMSVRDFCVNQSRIVLLCAGIVQRTPRQALENRGRAIMVVSPLPLRAI